MAEERGKGHERFDCQEFDESLMAYLEGEEARDIRAHAEHCSSCGGLLDDLEFIRSTAKDLPLESPSPRVWSNIRATLDQEGFFRTRESFWRKWTRGSSFVPGRAPAAALALAIVLAIMLVYKGDIRKRVNSNPAPTRVAATVPLGLSSVQTNLVHTVQAMEESYKAREGLLDPNAKQVYQAGLASLDNSIHECLDSLQKQPHNILVREYLMQAYAQKAEVLASALEYSGR